MEEVKEVLETQEKLQQKAELQTKLQEHYLKSLDEIEDGQLVTGTVVQVNNEYVFVDVGYKSEGRIALDEFATSPCRRRRSQGSDSQQGRKRRDRSSFPRSALTSKREQMFSK